MGVSLTSVKSLPFDGKAGSNSEKGCLLVCEDCREVHWRCPRFKEVNSIGD